MPHESRRPRIVSYDIFDSKRRQQVHRLLKGYGDPSQLSLFRCELDDLQAAKLRAELAQILAPEDKLLIIDPKAVLSTDRTERWDSPPPRFAIVLGPPRSEARS